MSKPHTATAVPTYLGVLAQIMTARVVAGASNLVDGLRALR